MLPGVRPSISFASLPTARTFLAPLRCACTATTRRLVRDDALALDEGERRGGPEIDGEVVREQPVDPIEEHGVPVQAACDERRKAEKRRLRPYQPEKPCGVITRKPRGRKDNRDHPEPTSVGRCIRRGARSRTWRPHAGNHAAPGCVDLHLFDLLPADRDLRDQLRAAGGATAARVAAPARATRSSPSTARMRRRPPITSRIAANQANGKQKTWVALETADPPRDPRAGGRARGLLSTERRDPERDQEGLVLHGRPEHADPRDLRRERPVEHQRVQALGRPAQRVEEQLPRASRSAACSRG